MMRSQTFMMAFITCSIMMMVTPLSRIFLTRSMASVISVWFSPAISSSRRRSSGWAASALASSMRFWLASVRPRAGKPADPGRLDAGDILTFEGDGAGLGRERGGDKIKECCLSRAVGADETQYLTLIDVEINLRNGCQAAEVDGNLITLKQMHGASPLPVARRSVSVLSGRWAGTRWWPPGWCR